MRCFIAVELDDEAREEAVRIQKEFEGVIKGKFVEKENLHVTLKFLGEIEKEKIEEIKKALKEIRVKKFSASFGELGFFTPSFIRVLWISLHPKDKFYELHEKIENSLEKLNIEKENKKFEPHVTLARIKDLRKEIFLEKIKKIKARDVSFEVSSFFLKKSILTKERPIYENLFEFSLL